MKAFRKKTSRSGEKKTVKPTVVSGDFHKKKKLPYIIAGVVIIVALILVGVWVGLKKSQPSKPKAATVSTACTDKSANGILAQAAPLLKPTQRAQLKPIVDKIKALPDYDRDPNCLAVVTVYYVNLGDSTNARQYYEKLNAVYKPNKGYDNAIISAPRPYKLKSSIEFLEKFKQDLIKNGKSLPV